MINWAVARVDLAKLAHKAGPIGLVWLGSKPSGSVRPTEAIALTLEFLYSPSLAPDHSPCRLHRRLPTLVSPGHPGRRRWSQRNRHSRIYPCHLFDSPVTSSGGCSYPHLRLGFQSSNVAIVRRCFSRLRLIHCRVLVRCSPGTCAGVVRRGGCRGAPRAATAPGRGLHPTHVLLAVLMWCNAAAAAAMTLSPSTSPGRRGIVQVVL
jgi:hypothetical protein